MVRCVDCANFNPKTRYCKWYNSFIAEKETQKNIPCPGFERVRKHHRLPDFIMGVLDVDGRFLPNYRKRCPETYIRAR